MYVWRFGRLYVFVGMCVCVYLLCGLWASSICLWLQGLSPRRSVTLACWSDSHTSDHWLLHSFPARLWLMKHDCGSTLRVFICTLVHTHTHSRLPFRSRNKPLNHYRRLDDLSQRQSVLSVGASRCMNKSFNTIFQRWLYWITIVTDWISSLERWSSSPRWSSAAQRSSTVFYSHRNDHYLITGWLMSCRHIGSFLNRIEKLQM